MIKNISLSLLAFCMSFQLFAQHDHAQCGVSIADQEDMIRFVEEVQKGMHSSSLRNEDRYVPVKFHMVADDDGKGGISPIKVLETFERVRRDFQKIGFTLYLHETSINQFNNSSIYEFPRNNSFNIRNKKAKAFNIFFTKSAGSENVLGYYLPGSDFIIVRNASAGENNETLTHELGHMLSLPHTFYGWEENPYDREYGDTVKFATAPGTSIPIELVDKSNCDAAADRICDTRPDYNFGITASGCRYSRTVYDRNGDLLDPMKRNYMSYFNGCRDHYFTPGQVRVMQSNYRLTNYRGADRSFLHTDYVPTGDSILTEYKITSPKKNSTTDYYDYVLLDWDDVPEAAYYQVVINEVNTSNGKQTQSSVITTESKHELKTLTAGNFISWSVKPFNQSYANAETQRSSFFVGKGTVSTDDVAIYLSKIVISPNPLSPNQNIHIAFESSESLPITISMTDIQGRVLTTTQRRVYTGSNTFELEGQNYPSGVYLVKIQSEKGSLIKKIIVQ